MTVKEQALKAVAALPETATFEDVLERLLFISKVERGFLYKELCVYVYEIAPPVEIATVQLATNAAATKEGSQEESFVDREAPSIGKQIEALRLECGWTAEELAEKMDISARSTYRHISAQDTPSKLNLAKYQRIFSEALHRTVVISTTSVNVSKRHKKS